MTMMPAFPDPTFTAALALTAVLALSTRRNRPWLRAAPRKTKGSMLPWMVLAALAAASTIFAVTQPVELAHAGGVLDPRPMVVAPDLR
jgi:hypothetical protein